jgi:hypothetical protein
MYGDITLPKKLIISLLAFFGILVFTFYTSYVHWQRLDGSLIIPYKTDSLKLLFTLTRYGTTSGGPPYYLYLQGMDKISTNNPIQVTLESAQLITDKGLTFNWNSLKQFTFDGSYRSDEHTISENPINLDCNKVRNLTLTATVTFSENGITESISGVGNFKQYCGEGYWSFGNFD